MKPYTIAWLVLLFLHALFNHEITEALWVMDLLLIGALGLAGVTLTIAWIVQAFRNPPNRRPAISFAVVTLIVGLLFFFTPYPNLLGTYFKFYRHLGQYEAVVSRIDPATALTKQASDPGFTVDEGPPIRVAFSWGGIIDNWIGIVYDPSGEVERANAFKSDWSNWDEPTLQKIRSLFGGDLRSARKLRTHWYFCSFT